MNTTKSKSNWNIGPRGWFLTLFGAFMFLEGGPWWIATFTNVSIPVLMEQLGTTREAILHSHSIAAIILVPLVLIIPPLYKKLGARKANILVLIIEAIAIILTAHVHSLVGYAALRIFIVFGAQASCQIGLGAIYGRYFPTKKGFVLGWATVGASATTFVLLPIVNALLSNFGFQITMYCLAAWVIFITLLQIFLVPDDPAKANYAPDNGAAVSNATATLTSTEDRGSWGFKSCLTSGTFWMLCIGYGIFIALTSAFMSQLVPHLVMNGIPQTTAVLIMSIMGIGGFFSSFVSGMIDQAIGPRKTAMIMGVCFFIALFCFAVLPFSIPTMLISLIAFASVMGAASNLCPSGFLSAYGPANYAVVFGYAFFIAQIIVSITPSILAWSLSATGKYNVAYFILAMFALLGFILLKFAPDLLKKEGSKVIRLRVKNGEEIEM